jgi:integrase
VHGLRQRRQGPLRATNFRTRFYNPAVHRAGLEGLTFHRLRHSAGALMRELGVPLEVIQRRLGHASIRTTADVYGSLPESLDRAAAAATAARDAAGCSAQRERGKTTAAISSGSTQS